VTVDGRLATGVDTQLKDVRPRVMSDDFEVVFAVDDLAQI